DPGSRAEGSAAKSISIAAALGRERKGRGGAPPHPLAFPEAASAAIRDRLASGKRKPFTTAQPKRSRLARGRTLSKIDQRRGRAWPGTQGARWCSFPLHLHSRKSRQRLSETAWLGARAR